jgi:hypothetical protein
MLSMLSLIFYAWISQSVPALPPEQAVVPPPSSVQAAECCCGEKCQEAQDAKCCADGNDCCAEKAKGDNKDACCAEMKHACCGAGHDHDGATQPEGRKCCAEGRHCQHGSKPKG